MKKVISLFILSLLVSSSLFAQKTVDDLATATDDKFNFIIATDLGRNGYYDQKPIADLMGKTAEKVDIEFIISSGDTHHYQGIQSTTDPLWMTNYELVYSHPELQVEWYPILGNHEYRGNTQAVIDYSKISRRWSMPDRYYSQVHKLDNGESLRILYIDTPPLIDKYREESDSYPDAVKQDMKKQLSWIDSELTKSNEKWKIVVGHHPIFAETSKDLNERTDMQNRVDPILKKHKVDMYISGHLHNFQHLKVEGSDIDYITNSSGSLSRKIKPVKETQFCSPETGFIICSASDEQLTIYMINNKGEVLYKIDRKK